MEKISVIVPVYKIKEQYLKECIESISKQTYSNLEIILVDDGSKDNSIEICKNYLNQDKRVQLIHQENSGVSAAIGAVSVSPYPCKNFIPISSTHLPTFASIGAAAETIILRFPPKLSNISLKTFLFISIFTFFKRFVICIIEFTIPSFLLFLIVSFIYLYRLPISNGTASIAVGFDSCKFGTIYLSPSHTATEHPHANGSKKPIVDSYV